MALGYQGFQQSPLEIQAQAHFTEAVNTYSLIGGVYNFLLRQSFQGIKLCYNECSPVGELGYKDRRITVNGGKTGALTQKLYDAIVAIQYGETNDEQGWTQVVPA